MSDHAEGDPLDGVEDVCRGGAGVGIGLAEEGDEKLGDAGDGEGGANVSGVRGGGASGGSRHAVMRRAARAA